MADRVEIVIVAVSGGWRWELKGTRPAMVGKTRRWWVRAWLDARRFRRQVAKATIHE
jgi:hypothetical protein